MSQKAKLIIVIILGLVIAGFLINDFMTGNTSYRTVKGIGGIGVIGYLIYTFFSRKQESKL
ncbi:hypothetical protein [Halobacillus litoralis]|uniref:hypothetical protein n=1 Tax=Halobacillus litoralis TaxID=45668 RepID=UPI001CFD61AF|nr:hypothetical protein [Halobacillus litoralis]